MTIKEGDTIPTGTFGYAAITGDDDLMTCQRPGQISTDSWKGKKIVLFGIPGSFTPTCQEKHLPPFIEKAEEIKSKGANDILVIATNDLFVQAAFAKVSKAAGKVKFISDADAKWLKEAGLTADLSHIGFGTRSARFAMIIDDLVVKYLGVEEGPGGVSVSGADQILAKL